MNGRRKSPRSGIKFSSAAQQFGRPPAEQDQDGNCYPMVGLREMVTEHEEDYRQDDEGVVFGAGLGAARFGLVGLLALFEGGDHAALAGEYAHPDVAGHDGAEHGAQLNAGGTGGEKLEKTIRSRDDQNVTKHDPQRFICKELGI